MEKLQSLKKAIKSVFKSVFDKSGWKKDSKKIVIIFAAAVSVMVIWKAASLFGIRTDLFVEKVKYQSYNHIGPNFSFRYPDYFFLDENNENKYGADYLSGIRLATDSKTGCDIRLNQNGINFQKSDEEIKNVLSQDLSKSAKDFKLVSFGRRKIGGEDSFQMEFSFTDPTGATVRLSQNIVSRDGQAYLFICGTGDYQYKFFKKDFDGFVDGFKWGK